jgi:hypothetical protein
MSKVANIRGVNKSMLMRKLWYGVKWRGKGEPPFYDEEEAKETFNRLQGDLRMVEVCGKVLHINLSGGIVDYESYDLRNGEGTFNKAVDKSRAPQQPQGINTQPTATEQSTTGPLTDAQAGEGSSEDDSAWGKQAKRVHKNQGR